MYRKFEQVIQATYARLESQQENEGTLELEIPELETWLISKFREVGIEVGAQSDFFAAGVDSLKAIQVRGLIVKHLDLGGSDVNLGSMIVFDCGSIERLARRLTKIRMGDVEEDRDDVILMEEMIAKYSILPETFHRARKSPRNQVVVSPAHFRRRLYLTFSDPHRSDGIPGFPYTRSAHRQPSNLKGLLSRPLSELRSHVTTHIVPDIPLFLGPDVISKAYYSVSLLARSQPWTPRNYV